MAISLSQFFEMFTSAVHNLTDHTGLMGVNNFDSAAHSATDHTGLTGVNNFDSAAHASTDHSGIVGIPSSVGADLVASAGVLEVDIPANTLSTNGDSIRFEIIGQNGGSDADISMTFGATTIANMFLAESGGGIYIRGHIVKTGTGSQGCIVEHS